ncbi:unnamed protein product [Prorocentrum cordatum]|uniref:Uncharacterized protein n=2 Tax=Prorocentrum cordatum TaxID=2364126 RepID=A0ABN9UAN5_9DINO|nr:unnamed protein product [Polarella glacialis]
MFGLHAGAARTHLIIMATAVAAGPAAALSLDLVPAAAGPAGPRGAPAPAAEARPAPAGPAAPSAPPVASSRGLPEPWAPPGSAPQGAAGGSGGGAAAGPPRSGSSGTARSGEDWAEHLQATADWRLRLQPGALGVLGFSAVPITVFFCAARLVDSSSPSVSRAGLHSWRKAHVHSDSEGLVSTRSGVLSGSSGATGSEPTSPLLRLHVQVMLCAAPVRHYRRFFGFGGHRADHLCRQRSKYRSSPLGARSVVAHRGVQICM